MSLLDLAFAQLLLWPHAIAKGLLATIGKGLRLPSPYVWAWMFGVVLLASAQSGPALARDAPAPPQSEVLQHYSDYTKDQTVYLNHDVEEVALSLFLASVAIWAFGFELVLKPRGDPLPSNLRERLDRLDGARLAVRALALGTKACKPERELVFEARAYDEIAASANALLTKARGALITNAVDDASLAPEIEALIARVGELSVRLKKMQPDHLSPAEVGDRIRFGWGFFNRVNRGWRRAFARRKRLKTIEQLNGMRWPTWAEIRGLPA